MSYSPGAPGRPDGTSNNGDVSDSEGVGMIFTNTIEDPIVLESSPTPAPQAALTQAGQPQRRRTTSSDSPYFPSLDELFAESYKAKRRTKREPSPELPPEPTSESPSPEPSPESSPAQKPFNPFDHIPRPGNLLPALQAGSPFFSASIPPISSQQRHEKRRPLPHGMTVSGTHMAAATKDAKKKKLRPNAGSMPISRRQEDPPLQPAGFNDRESVYLLQVEFKGYYATVNDRDIVYPYLTPLEYRIINKLIHPSFYFIRYITYPHLV